MYTCWNYKRILNFDILILKKGKDKVIRLSTYAPYEFGGLKMIDHGPGAAQSSPRQPPSLGGSASFAPEASLPQGQCKLRPGNLPPPGAVQSLPRQPPSPKRLRCFGCHCPGDMAVPMREILARPWLVVRMCHLLFITFFIEKWHFLILEIFAFLYYANDQNDGV